MRVQSDPACLSTTCDQGCSNTSLLWVAVRSVALSSGRWPATEQELTQQACGYQIKTSGTTEPRRRGKKKKKKEQESPEQPQTSEPAKRKKKKKKLDTTPAPATGTPADKASPDDKMAPFDFMPKTFAYLQQHGAYVFIIKSLWEEVTLTAPQAPTRLVAGTQLFHLCFC